MSKPRIPILGKKLMERWKIDAYELLQIMKEKKFIPSLDSFDTRVKVARLYVTGDVSKNYEQLLVSLQFPPSFVEEYEDKYGLGSNRVPSSKTSDQKPFPCQPGTKWEDVKITLIENEAVRIETPQGKCRSSYHELGMSDKRSGNKPTLLWALFKLFAQNQGYISTTNVKYDSVLPDTAKRLNKHLQNLFKIPESIFTGHYKVEKGYRTKIFFSDQSLVS
jgi:hypothetical protein